MFKLVSGFSFILFENPILNDGYFFSYTFKFEEFFF